MEIVAVAAMDDRRVADNLEAEDTAVEVHGRGHVEYLEERAEAVEVNGCGRRGHGASYMRNYQAFSRFRCPWR
jgi:hypothetical protein